MALSLEALQAKRDELVSAIAAGVRVVTYRDRTTEYFSSVEEMERALAVIDREMEKLAPASAPPRTRYASFRRDGP